MKEKPILFSAPMVCAILEGRKTQTRRVIESRSTKHPEIVFVDDGGGWWPYLSDDGESHVVDEGEITCPCPYGRVGDRLWVREAWRVPVSLNDLSGEQIAEKCLAAGYSRPWCPTQYEADGARASEKDWREFGSHPSTEVPGRYRHARFMPRWASRITLEVTGVRVERLQDITEQQALEEGIKQCDGGAWDYLANDWAQGYSPRGSFGSLWQSLNGAGSWYANPWVWVVEFKRVDAVELELLGMTG